MQAWMWIAGWYGVMSVATFAAYWRDKRAAAAGRWRVRERTLHVMELLGGWPGALVGQRVLRHKTRDVKFLVVFWAIVAAHALAWGFLAWRLSR